MARIRVLGAALAVAFAAGVLASAAPAVPIPRPADDHSITTAHFIVHYYTDPTSPDFSTETRAGDIAAYAEREYALEMSWGYPAPLDDGDGHIDIYLVDLSAMPGVIGYAEPDGPFPYASPDSGAILLSTPDELDAFAKDEGLTTEQEAEKTIAHELFHLVQDATWVSGVQSDSWLLEGTAQWAGFSAVGYPSGSAIKEIGPPDIALTCRDDIPGNQMCDADQYVEGGYSRWAFFQMLANKWGNSFFHDVFVNGAAGQTAATALTNAIAAKGSSLSSIFNEYAMRLMDADFGVPALATVRPPSRMRSSEASRRACSRPSPFPSTISRRDTSRSCAATVTRRMRASRRRFRSTSPCLPGRLPSRTSTGTSRAARRRRSPSAAATPRSPYRGIPAIGAPRAAGSRSRTPARRSTQPTSRSRAPLTVDLNTPATAGAAPPATSVWGTTVPVPTVDVAPSIDVFGPELLQLSTKSPTIRLIVDSSGPGTLNATLGSTVLGSYSLRAGNNDVRFAVPKSMFTSLRRSASASNMLTLTPMSPAGSVAGAPVTRHVVIAAAPKPKPAKHKKKK